MALFIKEKKKYKQGGGYEKMLTSADMVGGWVKKGQKHADVILEWPNGIIRPSANDILLTTIGNRSLYLFNF